jgi:hypothetical protein
MSDYQSQVVKKTKFKPKWAPKFTVSATYGKALIRGFDNIDVATALARYSKEILTRIRAEISQTAFSDAAKKRLAKALKTELGPSSLRVVVRDPLWSYLVRDYNTGPYTMAWLRNAKGPIPIVTETGKVIFRSATAKSMKDGRWVHPGRPAMDLTERAKKVTKDVVRAKLKKDVVAMLQAKMK